MGSKARLEISATVDRVLALKLHHFTALAREQGVEAARVEAAGCLLAAALFIDQQCGPRASYQIVQDLADELVKPVLKVA